MKNKRSYLILIPFLLTLTACQLDKETAFSSDEFVFNTYYKDEYFLLDNKEVHEEIALASHAMAMSTFKRGSDYKNKNQFIKELWKQEGFTKQYFNDYFFVKPETDSIAFGIASKTIKDFTLVSIAVRGADYESEWASNLTIGENGDHQGFNEASDKVVAGFDEYIKTNKINGHIKVWIAGYSRAAITSNMTAGKLLNRTNSGEYSSGNYNYSTNDIYAYCFEPPMGVYAPLEEARSSLYQGIHNFINYNDFVPLVAPHEWGFTRYGTDHYYPDRLTDIYFDESEKQKLLTIYQTSASSDLFYEYKVDDWKFIDVGEDAIENNLPRKSIHPSLGRFAHALVEGVSMDVVGTRENYYYYLQDLFRNFAALLFANNPDTSKDKNGSLTDIETTTLKTYGANNVRANDAEPSLFESFISSLDIRKDILAQLKDSDNITALPIGHMPELSYCWISACDSRILGDLKCLTNDGSYYILRIENPAEFNLFENNLKKTVFEYKNKEMVSDIISAEEYADGTVDIYLPKNGNYKYEASAGNISLINVDPMNGESVINSKLELKGNI